MRIRKRYVFPGIVCLLVVIFWLLFIHPVSRTVERDGWYLKFTYVPLRCPHCVGVVQVLKCNGRNVSVPRLRSCIQHEGHTRIWFNSPVMCAEVISDTDRWFFNSYGQTVIEADADITAEELNRGWYDCQISHPLSRKKGTPRYWCFVSAGNTGRWLDAKLLDQTDWTALACADTSTSQPSTASAPE